MSEGLPSSEVYHAMQDSKGYIWFATSMGVSRYNGYEFQNFSLQDGLADLTVFNIYEDHKGRIWFTSFSGKLCYYYKDSIYQYKYNDRLQQKFKMHYKNSIYVDEEDNIYLSVFGAGYYVVNKKGEIKQYKENRPGYYEINQFNSSELFLSNYGIMESKVKLLVRTESTNAEFELNENSVDKNARCIMLKDKSIWMTHLNNLVQINESGVLKEKRLNHVAISLTQDRQESIWIGTFKGGVLKYAKDNITEPEVSYLKGKSVSSVLQDFEGGLWFTTLNDGVFYLPSSDFLIFNKNTGIDGDIISCITTDTKNTVYAGLRSGKVYVINDTISQEIDLAFDPSSTYYINALFFDNRDKTLLAVTTGNHYRINDSGIEKFKNGGSDFSKRKDGSIWIAIRGGMAKLVPSGIERSLYPAVHSQSYLALLEDSQGRIWFGGLQGLMQLSGKRLIPYGDNELLRSRVVDIVELEDKQICVATKGRGVLFVGGDTIRQINTKNGLSSDNVFNIFVDNNILWLSTDKGLNKITFTDYDRFKYEIMTFTVRDGLSSNEVNQVTRLGGKLWVATNMGVTVFNPDELKSNNFLPPVYITGVTISGKDTAVSDTLSLSYDQNSLEISFIGLSFKKRGELKYRYKMEGLDTAWKYTTNRSVQFTTLPHGEYTFLIAASNEDGLWSETPAQLSIHIAPPFWKTWWFRLLYILALIGAVYAFFKIRVLTYNRDVVRELMVLLLNKFNRKKYVVLQTPTSLVKMDAEKILYVKASNNYVEVVTADKKHLVRTSMKSFYNKLPIKREFFQLHRSYIVRIDKIESIQTDTVIIHGDELPASKSKKEELKELKKQLSL
jgi:ligand-binding sensor domain-containing protein